MFYGGGTTVLVCGGCSGGFVDFLVGWWLWYGLDEDRRDGSVQWCAVGKVYDGGVVAYVVVFLRML